MNFTSYYPPYSNNNPYQQLIQMQQQQQNANTFIHVPSEDAARSYTVAPGGSVTFIDDNAPYCYTKTAGVNQFDTPIFRKFRLVEETTSNQQKSEQNPQENSTSNTVIDTLSSEIEVLRTRIQALEDKYNTQTNLPERRMKNESSNKQQKQ